MRQEPTKLNYRPDVDGLRAVAVLSVLAFHLGWSKIPGGFVGVDVFFVISGYLISSIIFSEIAAERFSVIAFYERRIRRIFPALFGMLAVSCLFAWLYLLPDEFVNFSKSMLAAATSVSNFYFWKHSGYFDLPITQPLLHTWSLAVEEQFYLTFPLFLLLVRWLAPRRLKLSVLLAFCVSLLASIYVVAKARDAAFYMPYTRAWELLLVTILSLKMVPVLRSMWLRNAVATLGIALIICSDLKYTQDSLFPGLGALAPCLGSAFVIWAGEGGSSMVGTALSFRPMVFIGLISYSLYLWHWPIIVLRQMGVLAGVGVLGGLNQPLASAHRFDMIFEIILSILVATLSWLFVERPFRSGRLKMSGWPLFASAAAVVLVLVTFAGSCVSAGGFKGRFPEKAVQVASVLNTKQGVGFMRLGVCFITTEEHFENYDAQKCLHADPKKPNYLLLGDSHSAMLWDALATSFGNANIMQASFAACEPSIQPSGSPDCRRMMNYIFGTYLLSHPIQGLLVAGRWEEKDMSALLGVSEWAKAHKIPLFIFGPVPEYDAPLPRLLAYSIAWNEPSLASQHLVAGSASLDALMHNLADNTWHVPYISLYHAICDASACVEYADADHSIPLMSDTDHLSELGASVVVHELIEDGQLREINGTTTVSQARLASGKLSMDNRPFSRYDGFSDVDSFARIDCFSRESAACQLVFPRTASQRS
jgi:peptidoglycan/LPS O-acetylase OafA/YrhL